MSFLDKFFSKQKSVKQVLAEAKSDKEVVASIHQEFYNAANDLVEAAYRTTRSSTTHTAMEAS